MFKQAARIFSSPLRIKVVAFFVRRPGEWESAEAVGKVLGTPATLVAREATALVASGILKRKKVRSGVLYAAQTNAPLFEAVAHFADEALVPDQRTLAACFAGIRGIRLVVGTGVLSGEPNGPLDLLIIAKDPKAKTIERAVRKVESLVALTLRYAVLGINEYDERRQAYDRLLRDIFDYEHIVIIERP